MIFNGDSVTGADDQERQFDDPLAPEDQAELDKMVRGFEEVTKLARAAKTYRDVLRINDRIDELLASE